MKILLPLLLSILRAAPAHAGPEQCEPLARNLTQNHFEAYVWNAKNYPNPIWDKYLACEGQKVKLESSEMKGAGMYTLYDYHYAIDCGPNTFRFGYGYYLKPSRWSEGDGQKFDCVLSGE